MNKKYLALSAVITLAFFSAAPPLLVASLILLTVWGFWTWTVYQLIMQWRK